MPELNEYLATAGNVPTIKVGGVSDHTEIESDGTVSYRGDSTVWDDIASSLIASRLDSVSGKLQYNYSDNSITMQNNGTLGTTADTLIFSYQKPHGAKADSEMRLHIHWEQVNTNAVVFSGRYRIQALGATKATTWILFEATMEDNLFSYTSGTLNQLTELIAVDLSSYGISSLVQFQLARTDGTIGDISATFVDAHIERDNNGSRQEYVK